MPSLVVIGQQIKKKRRGGHNVPPPAYIVPKYPSLNRVNGKQAIKMPEKDNNVLKYNNFHKQLSVAFVIYADFKAITKEVQGCRPNDDNSYTEAYQTHDGCGYGYKVVCC